MTYYTSKKLKLLWFLLVPLGWFVSFQLLKWIDTYPIDWSTPSAIGLFLAMTGLFGTTFLIGGAIFIAIDIIIND